MFNNILVVCTGNICRSPVGESLLKQALPGKTVHSAGVGALVDHPVEPTAARFAVESGLEVDEHRARQVSVEMLTAADLILVMSDGHRRAINQMAPQVSGKTMLFGRWLAGGQGEEIPDPYRKSEEAFRHAHQKLVEAAALWVGKLK
ncbi:low molecular weight phosphotyrosine protein phosphatase [bacterium Scap17]|nr:low molecular weight phosphotyrosine protein phosphatase [bacterium Scap17]